MAVIDSTIEAEGFGHNFERTRKASAEAGKNLATNVMKKPGRTLEIGAQSGRATVSKNTQSAISTIADELKF